MTLDRFDHLEQLLGHAEWITRLSRVLVGSGADADDVVQDAWLDVLRAPLASVADPRRWLQAIVRRRAAKLRRGEERRRRREQAVAQHVALPSADELTARLTMQRELTEAVLALDEPYRSTIVLRYFEQLDVDAIAARTGAPRNTVRSRLQRGLQSLRARLDQDGGRERWLPAVLALGGRRLAVDASAAAGSTVFGIALFTTMKKTTIVAATLAVALSVTAAFTLLRESSPLAAPGLLPSVGSGPEPATGAGSHVAAAAGTAPAAPVERTVAAADAEADAAPDRDAEPSGELLVHVAWADGEKAPGIHVYLARNVPGASRPLAEVRSDAAGEARARVAAGKVLVTSDRGHGDKELTVDVAPGERQEVTLRLAAGVDVEGSVRDGAGASVGGAQIWLSSWQSAWCAGAFVADSAADGSFRLRAVPKDQSLGAVAKDRAPSKLVDLDLLDTTKSPVHLALVLAEPGGALAGRVTDAQGHGVAAAIVAVGGAERRMGPRSGNGIEEVWQPLRTATAADGRYRIEGLAPGEQPVEVCGREFAYWHGKATIAAGQAAALDVELARGVTVFGTVTGEDGKPLAGACVRCFPCAIATPFLQGGQYDYDSTFGCPFAIADADGRYRLWHAAAPELHLYAGPGGYRRGPESVCWADEVLRAEPGATVEWNAAIDPGLAIRGVVRYRDGAPMANLFISLFEPGSKNRQTLVNDKQGRFRFVRLQKKAYDLSVQVWDPPKGAPPVEARDVWPGGGEVEIQASFDAPKQQTAGSVRGTISDPAGRLASAGALAVILATDHGSWHTQSHLAGASFHFKDVEPGRVRVVAMSGEDPILYGPWIDLQPAEDRDLGTLVTEPGGKLMLHVVRGPGTEALEPTIYLTPVGGSHGRKAVLPKNTTELVLDNMNAGEQQLSVYGKGMASIQGDRCTVTAAAEAAATIELRAAVDREIVVDYAAGQQLTHIRVQDERAREVFDYAQPRALERPYRVKLQLPLGRFTFRVETEGGGAAETTFAMTTLEPGQPAVVLQAK